MSTQKEIWLVDLDPVRGSEMRKVRPVVVINNPTLGRLPLRIIVPVTDWKAHYQAASWMIPIDPDSNNGLSKKSAIDCFQIRSVALERFVRKLGTVTDTQMLLITDTIKRLTS